MASATQIAVYVAKAGFRGSDSITAIAVALAESGGDPTRAGGLWGLQGAPADPAGQAAGAYARHKSSGWRSFGAFASNRYLLYIPTATVAAASADAQAVIHDPGKAVGSVVGELPGAGVIDSTKEALKLGEKAGAWIADSHNWVRVAQVIIGGAMVVGAFVIIARPAVDSVAGGVVGTIAKPILKGVAK